MAQSYHKAMTLSYKGGFPFVKPLDCEVFVKESSYLPSESNALLNSDVLPSTDPPILRFTGYQKSPYYLDGDIPVVLLYFREDDTIMVTEEKVNHKLRLVKRGKHWNDRTAKHYHWSDLNIGINITLQGLQFRLCDCDKVTSNFLISEGIDLNVFIDNNDDSSRVMPSVSLSNTKTQSVKDSFDKDGQVLRFFCLVCEQNMKIASDQTRLKACELLYYLVDDTMEVREADHSPNGVHPFCVQLSRQRVSKSMRTDKGEQYSDDAERWYNQLDLGFSKRINIYGRTLHIIDCDDFTRKYYLAEYNIVLGKPSRLPKAAQDMINQYRDHGQNKDSNKMPSKESNYWNKYVHMKKN